MNKHQGKGNGQGKHASSPVAHDNACSGNLDLKSFIDAIPFYVMVVDSAHHILMVNNTVVRDLKLRPEAIVGAYCPKVVHGLDEPYPGCPLEESMEKGENVEREFFEEETRRWIKSVIYSTGRTTDEGLPIFLHFITDISNRKLAEEKIRRNNETQSIINAILSLSLENIPFEEVLAKVLDLMLSIPWLVVEQRGAIFLLDKASGQLVLKAHRNLPDSVQQQCETVPLGTCLCGRAAQTGELQFAECEDYRHEIQCEHMEPHGHYCTPIRFAGDVLGVINLYLKEGKQPDQREKDFLSAVSSVLAGMIKRVEMDLSLKKRERELEIQTENLQEMNAALKVLLKKRDEDKAELEEKVLANVKRLVVNYVEKLRRSGLTKKQAGLMDVLESNLNEIVSPFARSLTFRYANLTPVEIQVADLIRQGKTTKEIASFCSLSTRTIEFHRQNIREKLGLKNKKANLRSHLLTLQ